MLKNNRSEINENKLFSPVRKSKKTSGYNQNQVYPERPQSPVRGMKKIYSMPTQDNYKLPNYISSPNFEKGEIIDVTSDPSMKNDNKYESTDPFVNNNTKYLASNATYNTQDNSLPERTIVLDIDETLLYTSVITGAKNKNIGNRNFFESIYNFKLTRKSYSHLFNYLCFKSNLNTLYSWVTFRPYLSDYLQFIGKYFDHVAVWSAGIREYVEPLVNLMFKNQPYYPELLWCRSECKLLQGGKLTKPLAKISNFKGWDYNNMILIDDQIYNFDMNKVNGKENELQGILAEPFHPFKHESTNDFNAIMNGIQKIQKDDYLLRQIQYFNDILSINDTELRNLGNLVNEHKMYNSFNKFKNINKPIKSDKNIPVNPNIIPI